ncbi:hypothetical protein FIBSPDRAFT_900099 [Athelia psychrophila]|uniref:Uncharacterized protein n=1 Tax=Athelia psychrophila TaxID=1759441 RepID=A0A165YVH9_9AGAM|nr:hypothetical protein FIBSPDRAFT_900099 [Fibularhizoctonia sp. CBS 109695]
MSKASKATRTIGSLRRCELWSQSCGGHDRFERWVKAMWYNVAVGESLPPLNVAMVWHAYLLNPGWYSEDTTRIPELSGLMAQNGTFTKAIETNVFNAATF